MGDAILFSFFMQNTNNLRGLQHVGVWVAEGGGDEGEETSEGNWAEISWVVCEGPGHPRSW